MYGGTGLDHTDNGEYYDDEAERKDCGQGRFLPAVDL